MKLFLPGSLWLLLIGLLVPAPASRGEPSDKLFDVYALIQQADRAEAHNDFNTASNKYRAALSLLYDIKYESPGWNPTVVEFRIKNCLEHYKALRAKRGLPSLPALETATKPATPPPPPVAAPVAVPPAPTPVVTAPKPPPAPKPVRTPPAPARHEEMTAELKLARERIQQLEADQAKLQTQLQEALHKAPAVTPSPKVEELLQKNTDLTAKLAVAQAQVAKLREESQAKPAADTGAADTVKLRGMLSQVRAELETTKRDLAKTTGQLTTAQTQLKTVQAENASLKRSRDELAGKLTEAERQLTAVRAGKDKDNQLIAELRQENARLRNSLAEVKKALGLAADTSPPPPAPAPVAENKGWWPFWRSAEPAPAQSEPKLEESGREKLTAAINSPAPVTAAASPFTTVPPPKPATAEPAPAPETQLLLSEATSALAAKKFDAAAAKYETVLTRDPGNMVALANLGVIRYQQGKLDEAETVLHKAAGTAPNDSGCRSLLGVIYFRKGKIEEAFVELTRAVALDPRNAEAHNYLGITLNEKGWGTSAEQEIRRAIELNPSYADAHFNLAVLYARGRSPRYELARYHYQKALDLGAEKDPQLESLFKANAAPSTEPAKLKANAPPP